MPQRPENSFTAIGDGVPVHYDRQPPQFGLGTKGRPGTWYCSERFEEKLDACFNEIWDSSPIGKAEVICTAGAWVNKGGMHGQGRAFDLDAIFWGDRAVFAFNYLNDRHAYLGIEAILRKHFGIVLNYEYNAAHKDHWHIDDGSPVAFYKSSESRVKFVQMAVNTLFNHSPSLEIDGDYGGLTRAGVKEALIQTGVATPDQLENASSVDSALKDKWLEFLGKCAETGLPYLAPEEPQITSPDLLLENVYKVVEDELGNSEARKRIEVAITAFASHPSIEAALDEA